MNDKAIYNSPVDIGDEIRVDYASAQTFHGRVVAIDNHGFVLADANGKMWLNLTFVTAIEWMPI